MGFYLGHSCIPDANGCVLNPLKPKQLYNIHGLLSGEQRNVSHFLDKKKVQTASKQHHCAGILHLNVVNMKHSQGVMVLLFNWQNHQESLYTS